MVLLAVLVLVQRTRSRRSAGLVKRPARDIAFANPVVSITNAPAFAHVYAAHAHHAQQPHHHHEQHAQAQAPPKQQQEHHPREDDVWEEQSDGADTWFVHRVTGESVWERPSE
jgi:hypothetical protein